MVQLYGMGFSYHTTYHTTIPYQVLQYAVENRGLHSQGPSGCVENLHRDLAIVNECKCMVIIIAIRRLLIKGIATGTDLIKTYNFETKNKRSQTFFW